MDSARKQIQVQCTLDSFNPMKQFYKQLKSGKGFTPSPQKLMPTPEPVLPQATLETDKGEGKKKVRRVQRFKLVLHAANTMYAIVRKVCKKEFKMRVLEEDACDDFDLMWADHGVPQERIMRLKPH